MADGQTGRSLHERIEHDLTNQAPADEDVILRFEAIRQLAKDLSHELVGRCPPGRELSSALTSVELACMWGVAAIARNQDRLPE